ncbi:MAG TPA: hypothetical protein VFZ93_01245 [Albitalea sp.]
MTTLSAHAATCCAELPDHLPTTVAPGTAFIDRARQMVAFLAERDADAAGATQHQEDALAAWISDWRGMPRCGLDATQHFVAEELGIIARALNGPAHATRLKPERTEELCWLIARCISRTP